MLNLAVFTGRITNDLELIDSNNSKYVRFRVAVQRSFKNNKNEYDTDFIPCIAWGHVAERIVKYLKKGSLLTVSEGSIRTSSYEKNGERYYVVEVLVSNIDFLEPKSKKDEVGYQLSNNPLE